MWLDRVDRYFKVSDRGSSIRTEVICGFRMFLATVTVCLVTPEVLSLGGIDPSTTATRTLIVASLATAVFGSYTNLPIICTPSSSLACFFICDLLRPSTMFAQTPPKAEPIFTRLYPQQALLASLSSGLVFLLLAFCGKKVQMMPTSLPVTMRKSTILALGVSQTFMGLALSNLGSFSPAFHSSTLRDKALPLSVTFTILIPMAWFLLFNFTSAPLMGTVLGVCFCVVAGLSSFSLLSLPVPLTSAIRGPGGPWFPLLSSTNSGGGSAASIFETIGFAALLCFVSLVETSGVLSGLSKQSSMPYLSSKTYFSFGLSTVMSSLLGTCPVSVLLESSVAITGGAHTGLSSVTSSLLFALSLIVVRRVPAAAPPLLLLQGCILTGALIAIPWDQIQNALPAFAVVAVTSATLSIGCGLATGLLLGLLLQGPLKASEWYKGRAYGKSPVGPHERARQMMVMQDTMTLEKEGQGRQTGDLKTPLLFSPRPERDFV